VEEDKDQQHDENRSKHDQNQRVFSTRHLGLIVVSFCVDRAAPLHASTPSLTLRVRQGTATIPYYPSRLPPLAITASDG
jgi:hypothetical protein